MNRPDFVSSLIRKEVLSLSAYKVSDASGMIKLDAMENPYQLPDEVVQQWLEHLKHCQLNRYPDPHAQSLAAVIRESTGISGQFGLLLGNGSDEIIQLLLMALTPEAKVLSPDPGFVMYRQISHALGLEYISVALKNTDFDLDLQAMLEAIQEHQPSIVFLAYPNNPTGNLYHEQDILDIIEAANGLVVIDEAYEPFANASFMNRIVNYENLLVMRTLSKLGLAGLRLGYIAGNRDIIAELDKIRLPYNINVLSQISAEFALRNHTVFDQQTESICQERERVFQALAKFKQLKVYPSAANFILFKTRNNQASSLFNSLKKQGVLIKNLAPQQGLLDECLRTTIGTPEENQLFLQAVENFFSV